MLLSTNALGLRRCARLYAKLPGEDGKQRVLHGDLPTGLAVSSTRGLAAVLGCGSGVSLFDLEDDEDKSEDDADEAEKKIRLWI